jgi:nucleotide-binding universal stress UspA family protein
MAIRRPTWRHGRAVSSRGGKTQDRGRVRPDHPADGIRTYLDQHPATLVVLGSRARTGLARLAFGSVAAGIVHTSPAPVLVVPWVDAISGVEPGG